MRRIRSHQIGIEQGDVVMFSDFENDGPMWTGDGVRQARAYVHFTEPFSAPPVVRAGLTLWDFSRDTNTRADIGTEDVSETGFAITFRTWGDTRVARVRIGWQAIGPLRDEDDWDLD